MGRAFFWNLRTVAQIQEQPCWAGSRSGCIFRAMALWGLGGNVLLRGALWVLHCPDPCPAVFPQFALKILI